MKGLDRLLSVRMGGLKPRWVWVDTDVEPMNLSEPIGNVDMGTLEVHLQLEPKENPRLLDLRALKGLNVHVSGPDRDRTMGVRDAAIAAGAGRVIATVYGERLETNEITDTMGVVWPIS